MDYNDRFEKLVMEADLNTPPPGSEPERRAWFLCRAKKIVENRVRKEGRSLTFCVETFGCQMNARDSEKLSGSEGAGFAEAASEDADFLCLQHLYGPGQCGPESSAV